jgi:hypothetical protein
VATWRQESFNNCITPNSISVTAVGLHRITSGGRISRRLLFRRRSATIDTDQSMQCSNLNGRSQRSNWVQEKFYENFSYHPLKPRVFLKKHDSTFHNLYPPQNHVNGSPKTEHWFILDRTRLIYCWTPSRNRFEGPT